MKRLYILTFFSLVLAVTIFSVKEKRPTTVKVADGLVIKKEWLVTLKDPQTPEEFRRPPDQTLLTFPEWYLVFSPDEQAQYFKNHTATTFPFMSHTAQIWESYAIVKDQIRNNFPYNGGYHFMIWVIGSSASVEYVIKTWYERIVGRITDTHDVLTDEDRFNAMYTQAYVDFINDRPWYEFDFKEQLVLLWTSSSIVDQHLLRKMERKYILTSELLVKWVYGKLIGLGTQGVYDAAALTTEVVVDSVPKNELTLNVIKKFSDRSALLTLPRYNRFNGAISELAMNGFTFREIAGNNSAILLTLLVQRNNRLSFDSAQIVFIQPIASVPTKTRIALVVPVPALHKLLIQLHNDQVTIEHVFDY